LSASLLQASSAADAGATLASLVSNAADAAGIQPLGISVRPDSARGVLARVAVRVAAIGDVEGLVDFVNEIEQSEILLTIRELAVEQPDVAATSETLHLELLIEALAILTAPEQSQHPESNPRSSIGPPPRRLEIGRATPSPPRGATADSLAAATEAIIANDPFRLARVPAAVRFGESPTVATLNPVNPPRPPLLLRAIVGGPPWQAVLDGLPGQPSGTVVRPGAVFETIRISAITSDTVIVQASDTVWKLTVKRDSP
jgi:hypothetical protein